MEPATYAKPLLKRKKLPDIRPGDTVRVHEKVKEGGKTRTAIFEGLVIARRHGSEPGAGLTVRKIAFGIGVERLLPLYASTIEKIDIVRRAKVRRAKLFYIRKRVGKLSTIKGELLPPAFGQAEEEPAKEEATEVAAAAEEPVKGE